MLQPGPRLWDSISTLHIINQDCGNVTCLGSSYTRHGRRCRCRCRCRPSQSSQAAAQSILANLATRPPLFANIREELEEIAMLLLCRRWHQSQRSDVIRRWRATLAEEDGRRNLKSECRGKHVERRSNDEECPICQGSLVNAARHTMLWCKRACGRNVHKECMEQWLQVSGGRGNCVLWYVTSSIIYRISPSAYTNINF